MSESCWFRESSKLKGLRGWMDGWMGWPNREASNAQRNASFEFVSTLNIREPESIHETTLNDKSRFILK